MRSVVVVLPASMCAMIPMFRVFWRVNLRGMAQVGMLVWCLGPALSAGWNCDWLFSSKKMGPSGPRARCWSDLDRFASLSARGLHLGRFAPWDMLARLLRPRSEGRL